MSMNYKVLKRLIARSAERTGKRNVDFKINIDQLNDELAELELVCIPFGLNARRIAPTDVPLISEYYREDKMSWISEEKFMTSLIFVDSNKVDENLIKSIEELKKKPEDDPDIDTVQIIGEILGSYPCYLSLIVSYQNNSPNSAGRNSYFIACRANKVIIKDPDYVYVPHHHVDDNTDPIDGDGEVDDEIDEEDV